MAIANSYIVIKLGTATLTNDNLDLNQETIQSLAAVVHNLVNRGYRCAIVSSGAVGIGVKQLGLADYPNDIALRQSCAAIGQHILMQSYQQAFAYYQMKIAQLLLTKTAFQAGKSKENLINCLSYFNQQQGIVPIINENDTVSTEELSFSDNDHLAVQVAKLQRAEYLFLLTSSKGLYDNQQQIIRQVSDVSSCYQYVCNDKGKYSLGGMASKLAAIEKSLAEGIEVLMLQGKQPQQILNFLNQKNYQGTYFTLS